MVLGRFDLIYHMLLGLSMGKAKFWPPTESTP